MIAAINPITVSQEIAEISNSTRVFIAHAAAVRCRILMSVAPLRNTGKIADSKFSHRVALHRRQKFLKSRRPSVEREYGGKHVVSIRRLPRGRRLGLRRSRCLLGVASRARASFRLSDRPDYRRGD